MTLGIFFLLLGGGIELLRLSFYSLTYQMLATRAARCASVSDCGVPSSGNGPARAAALIRLFATDTGALGALAAPFGTPLNQGNMCVRLVGPGAPAPTCAFSNANAISNSETLGDPRIEAQRLFLVRIQRRIPLLFGLSAVTVGGEALGTSEPPAM